MSEPEKQSYPAFEQDQSQPGKSDPPPPPYNVSTLDSYPPGFYPPGSGPAYCPPASGPAYCPPASGPTYCPPGSGPAYCPPASGPYCPPASGPAYCPPSSGPAYCPPGSGPAYNPPGSGPAYYPPGSGPAYYPPGPGGTQGPAYQPYYPNTTNPGVQQPLIYQPNSNIMVMNTQPAVVAVRPNYSDYLCWSILNFFCCCWPLGIVAIIYSCKTRSDIADCNEEAAARHSRSTRNLNIWALVIGLIINIMIIVIYWKYFQHHRNF